VIRSGMPATSILNRHSMFWMFLPLPSTGNDISSKLKQLVIQKNLFHSHLQLVIYCFAKWKKQKIFNLKKQTKNVKREVRSMLCATPVEGNCRTFVKL
jgi:hypothetical protein